MKARARRRGRADGTESSERKEIKATVTVEMLDRIDRAAALRDKSRMNYVRSAVLRQVDDDLRNSDARSGPTVEPERVNSPEALATQVLEVLLKVLRRTS